ncbi:MAG: cupin domain-containing protein [Nitrospiraceae bacterium]
MMTPARPDDRQDQAPLLALNALDGQELSEFERLIEDEGADAQTARAEVAEFRQTAARLATLIDPVPPPTDLRAKLMTRIQAEPQREASAGREFTYIRASEGTWLDVSAGTKMKVLYNDPVTQRTTALVRFAPGTRHTPHRHAAVEELFVLEGGCVCEGQALFPGDYHRSAAGSLHRETSTDDGCLLLITFSPFNETVGTTPSRLYPSVAGLIFSLASFFTRLSRFFSRRT